MQRRQWKRGLAVLMLCLSGSIQAMQALDDQALSQVAGQGLFVADHIARGDTEFHRMGLDVRVDMNLNIDKLQLGCGGFNEALGSGCDIDMDFVSLMGRNGSGPGDVGSSFSLLRPYVELATRKGSDGRLEVIGFKLGAQQADGFFSVGRVYQNGQTNQEHGGVCSGANPLNCHSGINRISGDLNVEVSGNVPITATALWLLNFRGDGCFGRTSLNSRCAQGEPFRQRLRGSRLEAIRLDRIKLDIDLGLLPSVVGIDTAYANIDESLRFIHGFSLNQTSDFFLSFQREPVAYPTYDKTGFAHPANVGWWMNVPDVKALDIAGSRVTLNGVREIAQALNQNGVDLRNIELNMRPASNCHGGRAFC